MKKIFSYAMLLMAGAFAFTSCSDDNDSNPTIAQPTEFVLNTPADANGNVDLANSTAVTLTWSQPTPYTDFNAPVVPTYTVQLSTAGTFNQQFDANLEDNTGADYIALDETYASGNDAKVNTEALNKALLQLTGWDDTTIPASTTLYVRVKAAILDASFREYNPIYSNIVTMKIIPYYTELKPADPELWYLIGGDIGDGAWGDVVGVSQLPLQSINGFEYDKKTGQGEITWTGYLAGNGFKLKKVPTSWDEQWGQGDAFGSYKKNDGGSSDIKVPEAGIYTVTLNTATDELKVEKYDGTPDVYSGMAISGSFNDWSDTDMAPLHTYSGAENHDWVITYSLKAGDEIKVKQAGSWDFNKGGAFVNYADGMYVYGEGNGANLVIEEDGTYMILFNDITGFIRFIKQ
ncbi:MAG: SusE domain-containing protein [Prevotella sp.]|nr:SusE domain-containing protein [Prevotella sp.]